MFKKLMLFFLALFMVGCSNTKNSKSTLHLNLGTDVPTLDPTQTCENVSFLLTSLIYDGLFRIGNDQSVQKAICKKVKLSEDKRTYTFFLKKTKWANNDPLTAHDFAQSWLNSLNPLHPSASANQFFFIKNAENYFSNKVKKEDVGIKIIDEYTLQVELIHPVPFFLEMLATAPFYPINSKHTEKNPNWYKSLESNLLTNGPFQLVSWIPNDQIVLKKNPKFWDRKNIKTKRIEFSMVQDANTELDLFESKKLDWAGAPLSPQLPFSALKSLQERKILQNGGESTVVWYLFNTEKGPLKNENFRKALALAINRKELMEYINLPKSRIPDNPFPPNFSLGGSYLKDADYTESRYYFEKAKQEMKIEGDFAPLTISFVTNEDIKKIAEVIQQQWKTVLGLDVKLEHFEWQVYIDKIDNFDYEVGYISWSPDYADIQYFLDIFKSKKNPLNNVRWENKTFSALVDAANLTTNSDARLQLLKRAEKIFANEMPVTPLYYKGMLYLANPKLKGYHFMKSGIVDLSRAYLEK